MSGPELPPARSSMVQRLWASFRLLASEGPALGGQPADLLGLEVCLQRGITYATPAAGSGGGEKFMTMVLGESPRSPAPPAPETGLPGRKTPVSLPSRCLLPLSQGVSAAEQRADPAPRALRERGGQGCSRYLCVPGPYTHTAPRDAEKLPLQFKPCGLIQLLQ